MPLGWNEAPQEDQKLPAWYLKARAKHEEKLRELERKAPAPWVSIPDRAPGYHEVGVEYSCVPDSQYPWDRDVFKAIQTLRPDLTPLWVRWIFLTPPEEGPQRPVVFGRHGLGRIDHLQRAYDLKVDMPDMPCQGVRFERPTRIWRIFEGEKNPQHPDLPGKFLPFNWNVYRQVLDAPELSVKELKQLAIDRPREEALKREEQRRKEYEYRQRDLDRFANKLLSNMSEVEMKERLLGGAARKTKPSVVVGKHA